LLKIKQALITLFLAQLRIIFSQTGDRGGAENDIAFIQIFFLHSVIYPYQNMRYSASDLKNIIRYYYSRYNFPVSPALVRH